MASDATFPMIGLVRLRMVTDGQGVTTLVAARGCPLRCRYCLNPQSWRPGTPVRKMTPQALYDAVRIDDLYFRATNGGVTFGGGEPLTHARFIRDFRAICRDDWRLTAETSLAIPDEDLEIAMACLDEFIVDIKDTNPAIYRRYTGSDNAAVLKNLQKLLETVGPDRVCVRIPRIPNHNTDADIRRSVERVQKMGATRLDLFDYILRDPDTP